MNSFNLIYPVPNDSDPTCKDVTLDATHSFDNHCDDVVDLTRQIVDQHRKVYLFVNFMKKYLPGFEKAQLVCMANMNGIRDSRRIIGEYVLRDIDVAGGIKFEDGIALFPEVLDTHVPTPGKHCAVRHVHYKEPFGNAVARPAQDQKDFMMHPFVPLDGYELRTNPGITARSPTGPWWPWAWITSWWPAAATPPSSMPWAPPGSSPPA